MKPKKLAVVGGGQMGRALVGGLIAGKVLSADQICLVEPCCRQPGLVARAISPGRDQAELEAAVAASEVDLVGGQAKRDLPVVAAQADPSWHGKLIISIAAGVSLDQLRASIGSERLVRVMPNTPSLVGQGASAYCCHCEVTTSRPRMDPGSTAVRRHGDRDRGIANGCGHRAQWFGPRLCLHDD